MVTEQEYKRLGKTTRAVVKSLSNGAAYHIWHHRLGHVSDKVLQECHKNCIGVPKLKQHQFFKCESCMVSKFRRTHIGPKKKTHSQDLQEDPAMEVGQHLHADFGFVRGSEYSTTNKEGKLITSKDGFRSYCLVIDRKSRYIWVFLTEDKKPPIQAMRLLLQQLQAKVTNQYKTITTDMGKELGASKEFQKLMSEQDIQYVLKTTGAHSSAQNGLAEKPNQDLARMMRSMLHGAGLKSEYWSYALRHAVYLKNRLPHSALKWKTPYEYVNKRKPDLSNVRIFGSHVHFMHNKRQKKLDRMDRTGRFMTYKGTNKIAYIIDDVTNRERVATHMLFDEAFMSKDPAKHPPMASAIQHSGYRPEHEDRCDIKVKLLHPNAVLPIKASAGAAGYDLHSTQNITISPGEQKTVSTGIALEIPNGYHGQLHVRSSFAVKHRMRVEAGLIDHDYRGEIFIVMSNNGNDTLELSKGDRVAQLTIVKDPMCTIEEADNLTETHRNDGKFGSTGQGILKSAQSETLDEESVSDCELIQLSTSPFAQELTISVTKRGNHETVGLELAQSRDTDDQVLIMECKPGTPAARIPRWRSTLRGNVLLNLNGQPIDSIADAKTIIKQTPTGSNIKLTIGMFDRVSMHTEQGVPMLYHDQLAAVSTHLQQIKNNQHDQKVNPDKTPKPQNPKTLPFVEY